MSIFDVFLGRKDTSITVIPSVCEDLFLVHIIVGKKVFHNAMKCVLYEEEKEIFIGDIYVCKHSSSSERYLPYVNKGYGTLLMNELLSFARAHDYKRISGKLEKFDGNSFYDPDHRDRQIHFYKKFNFKILPCEESPKEIELNL